MAKYKEIARFHPYMVYVRSIPDLALKCDKLQASIELYHACINLQNNNQNRTKTC